MVNQMYADLGIPNRFNLISSRFSQPTSIAGRAGELLGARGLSAREIGLRMLRTEAEDIETNPDAPKRYTTVKWLKRYAIGFLIALFFFTWADSHPDGSKSLRMGSVIVAAALWPITVTIVLGGSAADLMQGRG